MFGVRIVAVVSAGMFSLAGEAAQIYLCKTNQGGTYWASAWCRKTGGYTVDAVTVPDGMPFEAQARMGDQLLGRKQASRAAEETPREKARNCRAIDDELAVIWKRYGNWQFNENAQIARDQNRTRELKSQRARLGCETR